MLVSLGLDFHAYDVATRERFYLGEDRIRRLLAPAPGSLVVERVALATCNRLEVYGWSQRTDAGALEADLDELAAAWAGPGPEAGEIRERAECRSGHEVVRHLFRVASGLESQVSGDYQILGQVRRAYRTGVEVGSAGSNLRTLFDRALYTGKRVRSETGYVSRQNTIGTGAVRLAEGHLGGVRGLRCVVVGCGKTGAQAARSLRKAGAGELLLLNRTAERAARLAAELGSGARAVAMDRLHPAIGAADLVIVATGAPRPLVLADALAAARDGGPDRLVVIDVSMPRNVQPAVGDLPGVTLLDLDRVRPEQPAVGDADEARDAAEAVVAEEVQTYLAREATAPAREALGSLRRVLDDIVRRELAYAAGDQVAERVASRIVSKFMARPMTALREADGAEPVVAMAEAVSRLFDDHGRSAC